MSKTYLVTGGAGNLGSRMVAVICEQKADVAKIKLLDVSFSSITVSQQADVCREANVEIEWIAGSVTDVKKLNSAMKGVDVVFHMASIIDVHGRINPSDIWDCNVSGTMKVIDSCLDSNVPALIYTSSIHVLGPNYNRDPLVNGDETTEYAPSNPKSLYETTKREAEKMVIAAHGRKMKNGNALVTCALRPPGIYGGDDKILQAQILGAKSKSLKTLTDPSHLQSRMHVDNAAWSHIIAARRLQINERLGGKAYFVGDETPQMSYSRLNEQFFMHRGYKISPPEPFVPYWFALTVIYIINFVSKCLSMVGINFAKDFLNPFMLRNACTCFTVSHHRFETEFEYTPLRTWEESRDSTRQFVDRVLEEKSLTE